MAIGIVGNYGNDNAGDDAILEGIITQLEEAYQIERSDLIVFSNNPEQTREKYGVKAEPLFQRKKSDVMKVVATIIHNRPIFKQLDLLIIGGGGILMDLYRNGPIVYGMYGWLARRAKTLTAIYSAGAGPIQSKLGTFLLKSLINGADIVTVRDPKSKQLLQSIGINKQIDVIVDPAFFIDPGADGAKKDNALQIGVTAVPYYHKSYWPVHDETKYNNYITGMANGLDLLLKKYPQANINFFSTKHPYDTDVTKDIRELMTYKDKATIYDKQLTFNEIMTFIQDQDLIIGTRLHSVILAICCEKPILAIAYHQKVQDVLDTVKCDEYVIPIEKLHQETDFFLDHVAKMDEDWDSVHAEFKTVLHDARTALPNGMALLKEIYVP